MNRPLVRWMLQALVTTLLIFSVMRTTTAGAAEFNDGNGRAWRLVVVWGSTALPQIDQACPRDGATACAGAVGTQDLTGWVWGTDAQVTQLFGAFAPEILNSPNTSVYGPQYIPPVNVLFNTLGYTGISKGCPTYQPCWNLKYAVGVTSTGSVSAPSAGSAVHDIEYGTASMTVGPALAASLSASWLGIWQWRLTGLGTNELFAYDDVGTSPSPAGGYVLNVLDNDWNAGVRASLANVTVAAVTAPPAGVTFNADGSVLVAAGTPAGSYGFSYRICAIANPANCDDAKVTITVRSYAISALNDQASVSFASGANGVVNVLANDRLGGLTATPAMVNLTTISSTHAGITIDSASGAVNVAAGTSNGSHTLTYQICERANNVNCARATVTLTPNSIDAVDDYWRLSSKSGGTTGSVLDNDWFSSARATTAKVTLSLVSPLAKGITFNLSSGTFTIAPKTSSGIYAFTYRICETTNPDNCDTATATLELSGKGS
jgi:hypothetical protein